MVAVSSNPPRVEQAVFVEQQGGAAEKSGPTDQPGGKPINLQVPQSGRMYRVATWV
jgi:hypothetical protein